MTEKNNHTNQLPKGWKWVKLGDVCDKMSNGANAKQSEEKIGFPISRIETIWNETIDLGRVKYIQENDTAFIEKYSLRKDDILFSHINSDVHLGKTAIFKNQTKTLIHGINLLLIRLNQEVQPDFFNYQFKYKRRNGEFISIAQKSVNQSSINQPKLKNLDFVLPPKPTQLAIVSKIEELFSELEKGIESLLTAKQQLKTYRQSVLKWAFEGKLTNKNVEEGALLKGWKKVNLNEITKIVSGFAFKSTDFVTVGIPVIKISNIGYSEFVWKDQQYLPKEFLKSNSDFIIKEGDLLIALTRPITNNTIKICKYPLNTTNGLLNQRVACLKGLKINNTYLFMYLQTSGFKEYIRTKFSETLQPNLSPKDLALTPVPLCSDEEQYNIVQAIESRLSVADKMEESITQSLQQAEALKQSILKKAFEGKLLYLCE